MNYQSEFLRWKNSGKMTNEMLAELNMIENDDELKQLRFGRSLAFGTAGLRGIMAMGPGCMNIFTVAEATQGLANLINGKGYAAKGVAIACDTRNNSALFAKTAACVLAANGIRAYLFDGARPTPELSFAVRELSCIAGINITASHNPKEYHGYKAYWKDGAQLGPAHAAIVSEEIDKIDIFNDIRSADYDEALADGRIVLLSDEMDEKYLEAVWNSAVQPEIIREVANDLRIVYTPLHGAGRTMVPRILERAGLSLSLVEEQMIPDGDFPTVKKPNPEIPDAFTLGAAQAEHIGSDLVIATDPDADRVGVMSRRSDGSFACITGNQMGALLLDYVIEARRASGKETPAPYAVKSIVSTEMASKIAEVNGVKMYDVLTGFKFIGEVIKNHEETGEEGTFLLGFEESYGYLFDGYARDKDAVSATLLICEMTAYYRRQGMTLSDALDALYKKYGYYLEKTTDIYMEGLDGIARRREVMTRLRKNPPKTIGGYAVTSVGDYLAGVFTDCESGAILPTGLPESDVLSFRTVAGDKIIIRPSGTEPKIKIYLLCHGESNEALEEKLESYLSDSRHFAD